MTLEKAAFVEIVRAIASYRERDALLEAAAVALERLFPMSTAVAIALIGPGPGEATPYFIRPFRQLPSYQYRGRPIEATLDRGETMRAERGSPPINAEFFDRFDAVSGMGIALKVRDRIIGCLIMLAKTPHAFDAVDVPLAEEIASAIALAVDNCLAYEQISKLRDQLAAENQYLQTELRQEHSFDLLVGSSPKMKDVLRRVSQVAPTDATVLVGGESGTGKELVARAIHEASPRRQRTLVKINCAAISAGLVESELFGHEQGAFTGAVKRHKGRFELAHLGSLFLDEVGELPLETQAKLLRVLQEREFERVGGTETIRCDVRIIAATNRDLLARVQEGRFREDLYYRLNVFPVVLPPLRERAGDIPGLVEFFVHKLAQRMGKPVRVVPPEAMQRLCAYRWPGNVRELQNVIERAIILSAGRELELDAFFQQAKDASPSSGAPGPTLDDLQRDEVARVLAETRWVIEGREGAAVRLGLHPNTLRSRLKRWGLTRP